MILYLSRLYTKTINLGTVLEVLTRSEANIYESILKTLNELLKLMDEKDMSELYKVDEIDSDKIFSKMIEMSERSDI